MSKAIELVRTSNEWRPLHDDHMIVNFFKRYPWTAAFLILAFALVAGLWRAEQINNSREADRNTLASQNLVRDGQFCRAIPNLAESIGEAFAQVLILEARALGDETRVARYQRLGTAFADEAKRRTALDLPECDRILNAP